MKVTSNWLHAKEATNRILDTAIPTASSVEDKVNDIYNNNLPKAMEQVAIWAFKNPKESAEPKHQTDLVFIRSAMLQLDDKGHI